MGVCGGELCSEYAPFSRHAARRREPVWAKATMQARCRSASQPSTRVFRRGTGAKSSRSPRSANCASPAEPWARQRSQMTGMAGLAGMGRWAGVLFCMARVD